MASNPIPKKNWTKTKGLSTKRRHRELLVPLKAVAVAAVFAIVALASPDPLVEDDTLRRKKGFVNGPVVSPKIKQECTIRWLVNQCTVYAPDCRNAKHHNGFFKNHGLASCKYK